MDKWVNISEINNTLGKAIEACKDELTPAFYSGAKCVLDKINELAEPQTDYDKGLQLFVDIMFDKEKNKQFLKECKAMGIEPSTKREGDD